MLLPQQPAIMDNGLEGTEHVLVLSVDASANEYIVRTKSGAEVRVPGGRLSAVPVPPTAAEAAAALEPGMDNLTRWLMSITMTPIPKASSLVHLAENVDCFGFELSDDHMRRINALNRDQFALFDADVLA